MGARPVNGDLGLSSCARALTNEMVVINLRQRASPAKPASTPLQIASPPNNSLKPTRLAGEDAMVPCLRSCPRMKGECLSRRAAWLEAVGRHTRPENRRCSTLQPKPSLSPQQQSGWPQLPAILHWLQPESRNLPRKQQNLPLFRAQVPCRPEWQHLLPSGRRKKLRPRKCPRIQVQH